MKIINRLCFLIVAFALFSGGCEKVSVTKAETNPPASEPAPENTTSEAKTFSPIPTATKTPPQRKKLDHLKKWVGKYPINPDDKKYLNFFKLPEVKSVLVKFLPKNGFQNLLNHFYGVDLIEEKEGFLVMLGTSKRKSSGEVDYALVALAPQTGESHVIFVDDGKMTGYGNTTGEADLPPAIEEKISIYAE